MSELRIAFAYDPPLEESREAFDSVSAEYEDAETIEWLRSTLGRLGTVSNVPWGPGFAVRLAEAKPDLVFNITEASGSRNRESLVPAIAESIPVPCTGTDAVGLGLSLDKMITKRIALGLEITTPKAVLVPGYSGEAAETLRSLHPPLMVKPNCGGSSLGIHENSRVGSAGGALALATELHVLLNDQILVEEFVSGREITTAILETEHGIQVLPHAEISFGDGADAFYPIERKSHHEKQVICPASLPEETAELLSFWSILLFRRLGCADFARVDYRLTADGTPSMLEINPLAGLSPFYGIFCSQAQAAGLTGEAVIESIVRNALARSAREAS